MRFVGFVNTYSEFFLQYRLSQKSPRQIQARLSDIPLSVFYTDIFEPFLKQNSIVPSAFMCALFKQTYGIPPKQYFQDIRMKKAMSLLVNADLKIAEVALSVGYDCQLAFSGAFRKYTGVSPSEYRENKKCHTLV